MVTGGARSPPSERHATLQLLQHLRGKRKREKGKGEGEGKGKGKGKRERERERKRKRKRRKEKRKERNPKSLTLGEFLYFKSFTAAD